MYLSVFLLQLFYFHLIVHLYNYLKHISIMAVINTALAMFSHQSPRLTRENSFYKSVKIKKNHKIIRYNEKLVPNHTRIKVKMKWTKDTWKLLDLLIWDTTLKNKNFDQISNIDFTRSDHPGWLYVVIRGIFG